MRTKHGKKAGFERHIDELVVVSNTLGSRMVIEQPNSTLN